MWNCIILQNLPNGWLKETPCRLKSLLSSLHWDKHRAGVFLRNHIQNQQSHHVPWPLSSKFLIISCPPTCLYFCLLPGGKSDKAGSPSLIWKTGCMGTFIPQQVNCPVVQKTEGIDHFCLSLENSMTSSQHLWREKKWCIAIPVWKIKLSPCRGPISNTLVFPRWPKWDWFYRCLTAWRQSLFLGFRFVSVWKSQLGDLPYKPNLDDIQNGSIHWLLNYNV